MVFRFYPNLLLLLALCFGGSIRAGENSLHVAPRLGASSEFQFGVQPRLLEVVRSIPSVDLRDGVIWSLVEGHPGLHEFEARSPGVAQAMREPSAIGSLTIYPQNQIYDNGATVKSREGISAFADHAVAVAQSYPDLPALEVANEFNTPSFVKGAVKTYTPLERADLYVKYLQEMAERPALSEIRIIGAATHSIAAGYIWHMLDQGAAALMDAVSIHPYTSFAEQIPRQIDVLRRHPGMANLDIEVTEFGTNIPRDAPDFFWRNYCTMSMAGISRAVWYPLRAREDGFAPLFFQDLRITPVGRAYLLAQKMASEKPLTVFRPDPFTWGCVFDDQLAVIWGADRELRVARDDLAVLHADGRQFRGIPTLNRDRVLVLKSNAPDIDLYTDITLAPLNLIADSYYQFNFPRDGQTAVDEDNQGFDRFLRVKGKTYDLSTCPGQEKRHVPWFPYLCSEDSPKTVVHGRGMTLGSVKGNPVELVYRFNSPIQQPVLAEVDLNLKGNDSDGVTVTLEQNGMVLEQMVASGKTALQFKPVPLRSGQMLDVVIGQNATLTGDIGELQIRLLSAKPALSPLH